MKKRKVVSKRYVQNQPMLIPPSYEDLVPENHSVRVVNEVIEWIDIGELEASYKGGGTQRESIYRGFGPGENQNNVSFILSYPLCRFFGPLREKYPVSCRVAKNTNGRNVRKNSVA